MGLVSRYEIPRGDRQGMRNLGGFVEGAGNLVRRNAIDGILKVVVREGNGKRGGK